MPNTIQVKRGSKPNLPTLNQGEFGFTTDTNELFIGTGTQNLQIFVEGGPLKAIAKQNFKNATTLTISAGAITISQSYHFVDTEGAAATDDLDTINGGTAGDILYLRAAAARTVVIKHGTGNIVTPDGTDYSLDSTDKVVALLYDGTNWHLVGAAGGTSTFTGLTDTPSSYTGVAEQVVAVTSDETGLEFRGALLATTQDMTIYVNADTGSDTTGDGSSSNPYQTVNRALQDVPPVIKHVVTIVLQAATTKYADFTIRGFYGASPTAELIIQGSPSVVDSGTISSVNDLDTDPTYGTTTASVTDSTKSWTANAHQYKLLRVYKTGADDIYRLISNNTATTLYLVRQFIDTVPDNTWSYEIWDVSSTPVGYVTVDNVYVPVTIKFLSPDTIEVSRSCPLITLIGISAENAVNNYIVISQTNVQGKIEMRECYLYRTATTYGAMAVWESPASGLTVYGSVLRGGNFNITLVSTGALFYTVRCLDGATWGIKQVRSRVNYLSTYGKNIIASCPTGILLQQFSFADNYTTKVYIHTDVTTPIDDTNNTASYD